MASSRGGRRAERERNETIPLVQQLDSVSGVSGVEWIVSEAFLLVKISSFIVFV